MVMTLLSTSFPKDIVKNEIMEEEATDLTVPKTNLKHTGQGGLKVAQKRSVNFNLTIDFKRCDSEISENNNCDEDCSRTESKSSVSDFSDIESLCIPTTPGGRAQVSPMIRDYIIDGRRQ